MNKRNKLNRIDPMRIKPCDMKPHCVQTHVASVTILSAWHVIQRICPNVTYERQSEILVRWVKHHNLAMYERPNEVFYLNEAAEEAAQRGHSYVVVDNMS